MTVSASGLFRLKGNCTCYTCNYGDTIQAVLLRKTSKYMTALLFVSGTENIF